MEVYDLTCEHLSSPLGVEAPHPRLSWKLADRRRPQGQRQTAYRILVAGAEELLQSDTSDIWDSGVTPSPESHLVACGGAALRPSSTYYWKVMVYDKDGNPSAWSPTARFSTGLPDSSGWQGAWIKHPDATPDRHIWFRRSIALNAAAALALVHVASVGYHELYVNGAKADERVLAPALSRLDKHVHYATYDVKKLLRKGSNVVALWYGPGWSRYNFWEPLVDQALRLQLNGTTEKGDRFTLHSDSSWRCAESYSRNAGKFQFFDMGGEEVDGRRYQTAWSTLDFDDSSWPFARATSPLKSGAPIRLTAQMTDPSRIAAAIPAQSVAAVEQRAGGGWRVVMAKTFTGFLEAKFSGLNAGDTVRITVSDRPDTIDEFRQNHYYIARGENGETFRNRFNYFSGRYIYLKGLKHAPLLSDIKGYAVTSAPQRTGYFECSDTLFNRIHEVDKWTYEMCTTEGFTADCPHRERLGYGAESAYQTAWGAGLTCFASGAFYLKNVRDWSDMQKPDGLVYNTAPQVNNMYGGAIYGAANMNVAWEHYLACGDTAILSACYDTGKRWLGFLSSWTRNGMLTPYASWGWFLGDWLGPGKRQEYGETEEALFFNSCAYAMTLTLFARIADELNRPSEEIAPYREQFEVLRRKVHEKFFNPETGKYLGGNQVQVTLPLYAGIPPDALRAALLSSLEKDMAEAHPYFDVGSPSRYPYFKTLIAYPERFCRHVADILAKTTYPGYGYFLSLGETTWPEAWEAQVDARVHTSYVGISAWFVKSLAGIEPAAPGYRMVNIRPNTVNRLQHARAAVLSPYGLIESGWQKKKGKVIYSVTIPIGVQAEVSLPDLSAPGGRALHQVGAGKHELVVGEDGLIKYR